MNASLAKSSLVLAFLSAADLSAKKGYFVKNGADSTSVALVTGATDASVGVIVAGLPAGGHNGIAVPGVEGAVKVRLNETPGTVDTFTYLALCADGTVKADPGTGARRLVAQALEPGVAGENIIARLIEPQVFAS